MNNIFQLYNNLINKLKNRSLLPLIGFLLISLYIWGRYIRNRLPRNIPFNLNLWQFSILLVICCSYIYIIYRLFQPKRPPQIIISYIVYIQNVIKAFDDYLKQFNIISQLYKKIFIYVASQIDYNNFILWRKVIIIINTLPHFVLLFVLWLDIFYFHNLFYFYKVIWITLLLFIIPFFLHSFNYIKELLIHYWEQHSNLVITTYIAGILPPEQDFWHPDYDDSDDWNEPPGVMEIPFRTFIEVYFNEIYFDEKTPDFYYSVSPTKIWYEHFFKENNLTWKSSFSDLKKKVIAKDVALIIQLTAIMRTYNILTTNSDVHHIQKYIKVVSYIGYLVCWGYIIYTSFHTLQDFSILENIHTQIIQSKIWSPLKIIIFLIIMKKINNKNAKIQDD